MLSVGLFWLSCFKAYVSTIEKGQVRSPFGGGLGQGRVQKHAERKREIFCTVNKQYEKIMWQNALSENKRLLMI